MLCAKQAHLPSLRAGRAVVSWNQLHVLIERRKVEVGSEAVDKISFLIPFNCESAMLVLPQDLMFIQQSREFFFPTVGKFNWFSLVSFRGLHPLLLIDAL